MEKKRLCAWLLPFVLLFALLSTTAFAEGTGAEEVYVSGISGNDGNTGTQAAPYATLAKAVEAAKNGATIYVMSDLTMTECARFHSKSLTITSGEGGPYTVTRGDSFDALSDPARSQYNPAMIEVQTTGGVGAGLTLTNIIFDDAGKKEGTVFAQAVSNDGTGTVDTSHNTDYVQDAIIASNATVPSTITLGAGAVLQNFGGMSAVRVTGAARLVMQPGSVIEDTLSGYTRSKGTDTRSVGPAGAVWLQGGSLEMENGAEIRNINGRAVYADGGSVSVGGTISGIIGNADMWQATKKDGTSGTAIHLRGENASAVLTSNAVIENISGGGSAVYVTGKGNKVTTERGATIKSLTNTTGIYCTFASEAQLNGEITGLTGSNALNLNEDTKVVLDADGSIHDNACATAVVYLRAGAQFKVYGKINDNTSTDKCAALYIVTNGNSSHATLEPGGEICNNTNKGDKYGAAVELQQGNCSFTMNGGTISGNKGPCGAVQVHKDSAKFIMNGGEVTGNTSTPGKEAGIYVEAGTPTVELNAGKAQSVTLAANVSTASSKGHIYISDRFDLESGLVTMTQDTKTVTPARDSLNIKLGNASADSKAALKTASNGNGWADPFATFWAQRGSGAELTVGGLTFNNALPVYALVQETGADGKPAPGAAVKVYSTEITADSIRLTLPSGYANGCAVALAQPTADFGSVVISGPTEIAKTSDAATYEVPYTVTYTMSNSLLSMLKTTADIKPMSFVVELDSRLSAKVDDSRNCLYTFNGGGILSGTASVSGHTVTLTCDPLPGWKTAITGSVSVTMTLQCTGLLDAAAFAAGESLNTSAHISGTVSDGGTDTSVMIPSNVCRTRMTELYSVFYHGNEADSGETVDSRSYISGDLAVVSENGYVRDGHSFVGWNTQRDGSGTHHVPGSSITVTDHIHLYAQWTRSSTGGVADIGYTLHLTKRDAGDDTPLSGAEFELWRVGGNAPDTKIGTYQTDRSGRIQARVSQSGDYYWVEVTPPEGYQLDGTAHPTATSKNSSITVYNTRSAGHALLTDDHIAYIHGYPDGHIHPLDNITRAEAASLLYRLLREDIRLEHQTTENSFKDVPADAWYASAVSTLARLGVLSGRTPDTFAPNAPITRAEFTTICARLDQSESAAERVFSDIGGHWAEQDILRAAALGWTRGYPDGSFRPQNSITRAEAITMINRVLGRSPGSKDDLLPGMKVWPDNPETAWYYLSVQEATNGHSARRKADGHEKWIALTGQDL
mgnify:CR=1 FL=1